MFDLAPLTAMIRCLHLASMAVLVGGLIFARLVLARSLVAIPPEAREALAGRAAALFRPLAIAAMIGLVVSGIYQFYSNTGHSVPHNILFGFKLALALHLFANVLLIARTDNPRRMRQVTGAAITGLAIILTSALLHQIY